MAVTPTLEPCHQPFLGGNIGWSSCPWLGSPCSTAPTPDWRQEVPRRMPWATQDHGVVSFTGAALPGSRQQPHTDLLTLKRRPEKEEQQPHPKQFLSEEKMTAHFNSLSLENDHMYSTNGFPACSLAGNPICKQQHQEQRPPPAEGCEDTGTVEDEEGDVVLEGEFSMADCAPLLLPVSPLDAPRETARPAAGILPPHLLQSLDPSMKLLLWTPPGSRLSHSIRTLLLSPTDLTVPPLPPMGQEQGAPLEEMELGLETSYGLTDSRWICLLPHPVSSPAVASSCPTPAAKFPTTVPRLQPQGKLY